MNYDDYSLVGSLSIGKGEQGIQGPVGPQGPIGDNNVCIGLSPTSEAEIWFDTSDVYSGEELATKDYVSDVNKELTDRVDNLIISNGNGKDTELIDARDGEVNLGVKIRKITSSLDNVTNRVNELENGNIDLTNYATKDDIVKAIGSITAIPNENFVLRGVVDGEIFTIDDTPVETPPTVIYGQIVLSKSSTTINEGGSDIFTVRLDKAPTNNQVVTLIKNNSDVTLSATSLTFTSSNYSTAQTVTINVSEDSDYSNETCTITLTSPNVTTKSILVNINDNDTAPPTTIPVTGVTLDKSSHNLKVGDTVQLAPIFSPSNATNKDVTWSTSNSNCTVFGGLVTAVTSGECIITCTTVDGSKTATCNITIEDVIKDDETETQENIRFMFETKNINSGSTEIISNGITATLNSPAVIVDGSLSLNKNIITIPHTSVLQNRPFTIEFILKYDSSVWAVENRSYVIFDTRYGTGSGNGYRIGSLYLAGKGRNGFISLAGALGVDVQISDGVDIIDGVERTWKFIFTGTQVKTYIDGVLNKTSNYNYQESQRDILIGDVVNSGVVIKKFVLYDGEVI